MESILVPVLMMLGYLVFDGLTSDATPDTPLNRQDFDDDDTRADGTIGDDLFRFGAGDDVARMRSGNDIAHGGAGQDQISGGTGDDVLHLGAGDDQTFLTIRGSAVLNGPHFAGDDLVRGGSGDDLVVDFLGADRLYGGTGDDVMDGIDASGTATSADALFGGAGDDLVFADGADRISGGSGKDSYRLILDAGSDAPAVIADYEKGEPIEVNVPLVFATSDAMLEPLDDDLVLRVGDRILLVLKGMTDPDDVNLSVTASDMAEQTRHPGLLRLGTDGDDDLATGKGNDAIFTGRGDDHVTAGAGDDYISLRTASPFEVAGSLGWGQNHVDAGSGQDLILGGRGDDVIDGGTGHDVLSGGGGKDQLFGREGNDRIDALDETKGAADHVTGGAGRDVISADDGDTLTGGTGRDTFIAEVTGRNVAPIRITDFNPGDDRLEINTAAGSLRISLEAAGSATHVLIGGRAVFTLDHISPRDLQTRDIRVTRG